MTRRGGSWRVTRRAHVHIEIGTSSDLELAKQMAADDLWVQEQLRAGATLPRTEYLTPRHGRDRMGVSKDTDPIRNGNMSELPKCQCLSSYEMVEESNDNPDDDTVTEIKVWSHCGSTTSKRKRFKPGHDAKLKSVLIATFRAGEELHYYDGGMMVSVDPLIKAQELGWGHFMTPKPKKGKGKDKEPVFAGDRGEVDAETLEEKSDEPVLAVGYKPLQVKVRGRWKDAMLVSETDGTLTAQYSTGKGKNAKIQKATIDKSDTDRYKMG